ncbi:MAG TPA: universal stress protein [Gemmatimonadaceae bacterium]
MRKILVPLDGSAFAEQAVETARAIAHRAGAGIEFLSVHQPDVPASRLSGAPSRDTRLDVELHNSIQTYIQRIERAERARSTFEVNGVLREGPVADSIVAQAVEGSADLIVMTTHGRSGLGRLWLGSVADRVIRSSTVPVLLVRLGETPVAGAVPLRTVVVGAAGNDEDDRVVTASVDVTELAGVEYTLVHVLTPPPRIAAVDPAVGPPPDEMAGLPANVDTDRVNAAERYLEWMAGPLRARGATARTRLVKAASTPQALVDVAREVQADLVVVGTAARSPIARFFLGSTADKVVRTAPCSVLVCPPPRHPEQQSRF